MAQLERCSRLNPLNGRSPWTRPSLSLKQFGRATATALDTPGKDRELSAFNELASMKAGAIRVVLSNVNRKDLIDALTKAPEALIMSVMNTISESAANNIREEIEINAYMGPSTTARKRIGATILKLRSNKQIT